jgi:GxxExxY protein
MTNDNRDPLTDRIIGLAIEVHRSLGPGLLESTYEECLCYEFSQHGIQFQRQVPLAVRYKDVRLDRGYRLDIVVERSVIVEIKSVEKLSRLHEAQLLTYLKLSGIRTGLLLNFNFTRMRQGIKAWSSSISQALWALW